MRLTVLGACGAWPEADQAGSGHHAARTAAASEYNSQISVATTGLSLDLG